MFIALDWELYLTYKDYFWRLYFWTFRTKNGRFLIIFKTTHRVIFTKPRVVKAAFQNIGDYIDLNVIFLAMWFLSIFLNSDLGVLREARWTGLFFFSVPARSHACI